LSDDDPALQAFRCIHLMLRSNELRDVVPLRIVHCIRTLIGGGETNNCPKLSIAGLDLLSLLHARMQALISHFSENKKDDDVLFWATYWLSIVEGMAEASNSRYPSTRQHSIAMFTDSLVDRHGQDIPMKELCKLLNGVCIPMAGKRISELIQRQMKLKFDHEEIMIELEQCISAIFKPFLHYLKRLTTSPEDLTTVWMSVLSVLADLLGTNPSLLPADLLNTTKQLATEHLRNAIMILMSKGIITAAKTNANGLELNDEDISSLTWNAIENISYVKPFIIEWMQSGSVETK